MTTEPKTELLPCPFCGGKNVHFVDPTTYVMCRDCYSYGPNESCGKTMKWNSRAEPPTNQGEAARDRQPDEMPTYQGDEQRQAVGREAEGEVPIAAPINPKEPSPAIPPGRVGLYLLALGPVRERDFLRKGCEEQRKLINALAGGLISSTNERNELLAAKGNLERMERCVAAEQEWEILTAERDELRAQLAATTADFVAVRGELQTKLSRLKQEYAVVIGELDSIEAERDEAIAARKHWFCEVERQQARAAKAEALWSDPAALHANLLRSPLCPEMRAKFLHLAGVDADIQQRAEKSEKHRFAEQSRADFLSGELAKARMEKAAFEQAWLSAEARANEQSLEAWRSQVNQDLAETTQRADLAEDEIERLKAQNAELVAALKDVRYAPLGDMRHIVCLALAKIEGGAT